MGMKKCKSCGEKISSNAKSCPHCGRRKTGFVAKLFAGIFILTGVGVIWAIASNESKQNQASQEERERRIALTPQQREEEDRQRATQRQAEEVLKREREIRFQNTLGVVETVKGSLHDPGTAQWEGIWANKDGTTVCMKYRAKNKLGAYVLENATYTNNRFFDDAETWNRVCASPEMYDMKHIRQGL